MYAILLFITIMSVRETVPGFVGRTRNNNIDMHADNMRDLSAILRAQHSYIIMYGKPSDEKNGNHYLYYMRT